MASDRNVEGRVEPKPDTAVSCITQMKASRNRFILVFGLSFHFMVTTPKAKGVFL